MFYKIEIESYTGRRASYDVQRPKGKNGVSSTNIYKLGILDYVKKISVLEFGQDNTRVINIYWTIPAIPHETPTTSVLLYEYYHH